MTTPVVEKEVRLAPFTSLRVGGPAEALVKVRSATELEQVLADMHPDMFWLLGWGTNSLISDAGLRGLVICTQGGTIEFEDTSVTADAGVWWDDLVSQSVERGLWGLELMSYIPGSVGAAVFINITAYGQSLGSRINWVEYWDADEHTVKRISSDELQWGYKQSVFQSEQFSRCVILRANFTLSSTPLEPLEYERALEAAKQLKKDPNDLNDRRLIVQHAREAAGSIWLPNETDQAQSAGSFFRNPLVSRDVAERVIQYDETGKTKAQIQKMNAVHGGDELRVSAAHVLLAAGFQRDQRWGNVRLHPKNLLKIETLEGATAQEVYDLMRFIRKTCKNKLDVELKPEVRILGSF